MKAFIHLALPSGHVYQLPTAVVANNRAAYYHRELPDEFPTLQAALDDTVGLFDDAYQIKDWAQNQMNWEPDLLPHAQMVRFVPPELDFAAAEWQFRDSAVPPAELEAETLNLMPLQMLLNSMAATRNICNVSTMDGPNGPDAALVVLQGGPQVVSVYINALQITTEMIARNAPAPAPAH